MVDVDYFRVIVERKFVATQLAWKLSSFFESTNFDTEGLVEIANSPSLLYIAKEAKEGLLREISKRLEGARPNTSDGLFLYNARTISGGDLLVALSEAKIAVSAERKGGGKRKREREREEEKRGKRRDEREEDDKLLTSLPLHRTSSLLATGTRPRWRLSSESWFLSLQRGQHTGTSWMSARTFTTLGKSASLKGQARESQRKHSPCGCSKC